MTNVLVTDTGSKNRRRAGFYTLHCYSCCAAAAALFPCTNTPRAVLCCAAQTPPIHSSSPSLPPISQLFFNTLTLCSFFFSFFPAFPRCSCPVRRSVRQGRGSEAGRRACRVGDEPASAASREQQLGLGRCHTAGIVSACPQAPGVAVKLEAHTDAEDHG